MPAKRKTEDLPAHLCLWLKAPFSSFSQINHREDFGMATNQQVIDRWLDNKISSRGLESKSLTAADDTLRTYWKILAVKRPWGILCQRQDTYTSKRLLSRLYRAARERKIKTLAVLSAAQPESTMHHDIPCFKHELKKSLCASNKFPHRYKDLTHLVDLASLQQVPFPHAPLLPVLAQMQERPYPTTKEDRRRCRDEAQALLTMIDLLENHASGPQ